MNGEAPREMPRYKCHKEVHALKIAEIGECSNDGVVIITPADDGYAPFHVDRDYINRHHPKVGGYYVVYKDGYKSYSPPEAFEEGYTRI
jgi:hypothetical protein